MKNHSRLVTFEGIPSDGGETNYEAGESGEVPDATQAEWDAIPSVKVQPNQHRNNRKSLKQVAAEIAMEPVDESPTDRATELANCEEVHRRHGDHLRFHSGRGCYFTFTGRHWAQDTTGQVPRWVKDVARTSSDRLAGTATVKALEKFQGTMESARGITGVMKLLQTEPNVTLSAGAFDSDDYLLNVANGTLELRGRAILRPHSPADLITHCLSTPYKREAECPLWESVVSRSMGGNPELVGYLRRWAGKFIIGSASDHELLIAHGAGANGKSVIFDTLCGMLESLAGVAPESLLIARHGQSEHPTEIADLLGKRLVVASETESGATLRLQLIKRLTGDATIKARFMRCDFIEFRRTHSLVLITNNRPRLTENTEAVWRRLRLLPFNVVIPPHERDPHLLDKLRAEWPGILAWCVEGCIEAQQHGMKPPAEVLVATEDYRHDADELADFITSCFIIGETFRTTRSDVNEAYIGWTKQVGERHPMERGQLYEAIRRREGISEAQWKVGGKAARGFTGIGIVKTGNYGGENES